MEAQTHRFALSDEERMVRQAASDFVADRMPVQALRSLRDQGAVAGYDPATWAEMADLGWPGIAIAETFGGSGLGARALALIIEEMGKTLAASPLASTALVAALTIGRCATADVAARWLPGIAKGAVTAALAVEEAAHPSDRAIETHTDGIRLTGTKSYVADGVGAGLLLVSARYGDGVALALVRAPSPGVAVTRLDTIDGRGLAAIRFDNAPVDALLVADADRDPVDYAQDVARIALAAEMLGACDRAFEVTLDYLRTRRQFGQAIGSFQALQHRAAKLFIEIELARSCVGAAADALHHDRADVPLLASLAKAMAAELMRTMSHEMIQFHGGIGMTDAHDAGLYLKRGRVAALLHGDAPFHVERFARLRGYR